MVIDLRIDKPRFMVFGEIALRATALAAEPLLLILDVHKPRPSDISIHVTSKSLRAEVLRIVGGVDAEIKRFIAAHVSGEIDSPESRKAKVIDVGSADRRGVDGSADWAVADDSPVRFGRAPQNDDRRHRRPRRGRVDRGRAVGGACAGGSDRRRVHQLR